MKYTIRIQVTKDNLFSRVFYLFYTTWAMRIETDEYQPEVLSKIMKGVYNLIVKD